MPSWRDVVSGTMLILGDSLFYMALTRLHIHIQWDHRRNYELLKMGSTWNSRVRRRSVLSFFQEARGSSMIGCNALPCTVLNPKQ